MKLAPGLGFALLALAPLLPFLDAAFTIDSPVFLAVARQILRDPFDPFAFEMVWDPTSAEVALFNRNPPLLSYYLAPWIAAFGEREWILHGAMLPFPMLAAACFAGIARRFCEEWQRPTLLLVWSPAFVLLATTLMLDVAMLSLQLLAVHALLHAIDDTPARARWAWTAGLAAAAAGLTKYVGFGTAPLLAAAIWLWPADESATSRARRAVAWRALAPPLVVWSLWGVWSAWLYGEPHFGGGLALALQKFSDPPELWTHWASLPAYYGAALVFPAWVWLARWRRGAWGTEFAAITGALGAGLALLVIADGEPARRVEASVSTLAFAAWAIAGALLWIALVWRRHAAVDRLCVLWLAGQVAYSALLNWHVAASDALIAAPPLLLLLFRNERMRPSPREATVWIALGGSLALTAAAADVEQRAVHREVAPRIAREVAGQPGARWLIGQWGFQYYLEREGFRALPPVQHRSFEGVPRDGDWIASARNAAQLDVRPRLAGLRTRPVGRWEREARLPLRVTHPDSGAGFHSHRVGHLPFAPGRPPLERLELGRLRRPPGTR